MHRNGVAAVGPFPRRSIRFMMQVGRNEVPVPEVTPLMEDGAC